MRWAAIIATVAMAVVGCDSSTSTAPQEVSSSTAGTVTSASSTASSTVASSTSAAPASVSENNPCAGATFTPQQFVGDWTEQGGTLVTTLGGDGTLSSRDGASVESGTWSYTPWEFTPARDQMPESAANQCVLWLRIDAPAPPSNLVYVPLKVADTSLELSFVGRGNTIVWVRAAGTS